MWMGSLFNHTDRHGFRMQQDTEGSRHDLAQLHPCLDFLELVCNEALRGTAVCHTRLSSASLSPGGRCAGNPRDEALMPGLMPSLRSQLKHVSLFKQITAKR